MVHRDLRVAVELFGIRDELDDFYPIERPAMGLRSGSEFFLGFRQGDVETLLSVLQPFEQELERTGSSFLNWGRRPALAGYL